MPAAYEAIRDKLAKTMPLAEAKTRAARIYNASRKPGEPPVTRSSYAEQTEPEANPREPDQIAKFYSEDDLNDPNQFRTYRNVPLLDIHNDPEHGPVDEPLLHLIAENSNKRITEGEMPTISLGHTQSKSTVVLIENGKKTVFPATDEVDQPVIVGYPSHFDVLPYAGKPCLHATMHVANEHMGEVKGYPFRSIERLAPNPKKVIDPKERKAMHAVDRIALLRTPPRRNLGAMKYDRDDSRLLRFCYSRADFPPIGDDGKSCHYSSPEGNPMPAMAPAEAPPVDDAAPAPDAGGEQDEMDQPITSMSRGDMMMMITAVVEHVLGVNSEGEEQPEEQPEPATPDGSDTANGDATAAQYEDSTDVESGVPDVAASSGGMSGMDDEDGMERANYDASGMVQAGGSDTYIPNANGKGKEKRAMYERGGGGNATTTAIREQPPNARGTNGRTGHTGNINLADLVTRHQYAKDQGERDDINTFLFDQVMALQLDKRRLLYEKRIDGIRGDGYDIDDETQVDLINELTTETPADYEDRKEAEIRKRYARRAVSVPMVPVGSDPFAPQVRTGAPTREQSMKAVALAMESGGKLSIPDALKQVRGA